MIAKITISHANLTACWARKKLAESYKITMGVLTDPLFSFDEFLMKIT